MTAYVYGAWEPGYVSGINLYVYGESGVFSAEALRAYAERVYLPEHSPLHIGVIRVGVVLVGRASERAL